MGLQDRDYYQERPRGLEFQAGSVVFILVAVSVAVWLVQVAFIHSTFRLEHYFGARPADVFERFYLWQPLTANFLHAPERIGHIVVNMLFLYFFGREVEAIYGRRDFLIFYLAAGTVAILTEAAFNYYLFDRPGITILGASGAVMALVVLFTTFYPRREIYLAFFIPIQAWLLCILFLIWDLYGAVGESRGAVAGVAFLAHLSGAAFGLLYRFLDLRWDSLRARLGRPLRSPRRRSPRPRLVRPAPTTLEDGPPAPADGPERDPVSVRIDQILEKISRSGRESLTQEELDYLQRNSGRYRSENRP